MVDNFDLIENLLKFESADDFLLSSADQKKEGE